MGMNDISSLLFTLAITLPPAILAFTGAAIATAYAADALGDKTPRFSGRLTMNPAKHVDPIGTIVVPGLLSLLNAGLLLGWAKLVPLDERAFKNPTRDVALVALASTGAHLVMALAWAVVVRLALSGASVEDGSGSGSPIAQGFFAMGLAGIRLNLFFAIFSLLPVPGWPGGHILRSLLSPSARRRFDDLPPWTGLAVIGVLILIPGLSGLIVGPVNALAALMLKLVGVG